MRNAPEIVQDYLLRLALEDRRAAYFCVDGEGRVLRAGGELERYGLDALEPGADASSSAYWLVGILPPKEEQIIMPRLEVAPEAFADVHILLAKKECWIVLLDAGAEVAERVRLEQALRQAEEHLRQAERMEAVGRLAGGIAHDFNNLLMVILGYGELMLGRLDDRDPLYGPALEVRKAADRGALLVRQLLAFSGRQVVPSRAVDLNEVVTDATGMLRRIVGEDVRFELKLEQGLPPIRADRSRMQQVVLNLAVNARDAMPGGGVLTIETANSKDALPPVRAEWVVLRVADTGVGMDEETQARIFEPFFTTKEMGRGTGLGLSTVHGIVTQSGGEISVRSAPGKGTVFEIRFPRSGAAAVPAAEAETKPVARSRGETVLVVEDDELVFGLVRQFLERMNYQVLGARTPQHAIDVSEHFQGSIDLLLTDVVMPQMGGIELSEQLRARRPGLKTLFMSGFSRDAIRERRSLDFQAPFIEKPFTREQLAEAIREALDASD